MKTGKKLMQNLSRISHTHTHEKAAPIYKQTKQNNLLISRLICNYSTHLISYKAKGRRRRMQAAAVNCLRAKNYVLGMS